MNGSQPWPCQPWPCHLPVDKKEEALKKYRHMVYKAIDVSRRYDAVMEMVQNTKHPDYVDTERARKEKHEAVEEIAALLLDATMCDCGADKTKNLCSMCSGAEESET